MGRTWDAYGSTVQPDGDLVYVNIFSHLSALRMCGIAPESTLSLTLVEDPDGDYFGWIDTGKTEVYMVQYKRIFQMQFPYSVAAEVEAGNGEVVRLRVVEKSV